MKALVEGYPFHRYILEYQRLYIKLQLLLKPLSRHGTPKTINFRTLRQSFHQKIEVSSNCIEGASRLQAFAQFLEVLVEVKFRSAHQVLDVFLLAQVLPLFLAFAHVDYIYFGLLLSHSV